MKMPKYDIGDEVLMLNSYTESRIQRKIIYGMLPRLEIGRVVGDKTIWGCEKVGAADEKAWLAIPPEKREISWRVKEWEYMVAKDGTDMHVLSLAATKDPRTALEHFVHGEPESKLFANKGELIQSLIHEKDED